MHSQRAKRDARADCFASEKGVFYSFNVRVQRSRAFCGVLWNDEFGKLTLDVIYA